MASNLFSMEILDNSSYSAKSAARHRTLNPQDMHNLNFSDRPKTTVRPPKKNVKRRYRFAAGQGRSNFLPALSEGESSEEESSAKHRKKKMKTNLKGNNLLSQDYGSIGETRWNEIMERIHPTSTICKTCGQHFKTPWALKRHNDSFECDKVLHFKCEKCGKSFRKMYNLKRHIKADFCTKERKAVVTTPKPIPARVSTNLDLKCKTCDKKFQLEKRLRKHESKAECGLIFCRKCGKDFINQHARKKHENSVDCSATGRVTLQPVFVT